MPHFDLDKLLDAVDLPALAQKYGAKFTRKTGDELRCACPLHGGKNPTAFAVYQDNHNRWHWRCYTDCDAGGDALEFLRRAENLQGKDDFMEAVKRLAEYAHLSLEDIGFTPERIAEIAERKKRTDVLDLAARYFAARLWSAEGAEALAYVRGRAFTDDTIRMAGWGFSDGGPGLKTYLENEGADMALARKLGLIRADGLAFTANQDGQIASPAGWLIYPHRPGMGGFKRQTCPTCQEADTWHAKTGQEGGVCLRHDALLPTLTGIEFFSSRALAPVDPKDKARNLPGPRYLYKAEVPGQRKIILVEGPADAESLRQLGFSTWALCGLGALPEPDLHLLKQRPARFLALDGDDAGQTKIEKLANVLGPLTRVVAPFEEGKDANAFLQAGGTAGHINTTLAEADVWLETLLEKTHAAAPDELVELTTQIAVLLRELPDSLAPRYYQLAGKKLGMTRRELQALTNGQGKQNGQLSLASVRDGQMCFLGEPLGNFSGLISREIAEDNGRDLPKVRYEITGKLAEGMPLEAITIDAKEFASMTWIPERWGARVIPYVSGSKTYLMARAIQELSLKDLVRERVFTHTGFRIIEGKRGYLSASGFLTTEGLDERVRVDLGDNNLQHYRLPPPPEGEALKVAIRASVDFLKIGPRHVTAPIWTAMYAAPLTEVLALYTVLWIYGATQSGKSTIAHLALTHFGTGFVSGRQYHAPENWESSSNAHEFAMFTAKDAPIVIDDYAPQFASTQDARDMAKKAQRLIRSVGNRAARGRMKPNMTQQLTFIPRGLTIVTAELPLPGESTVGRMLYVPIDRGEVMPNPGELSRPHLDQAQEQAQAGQYALAMAAYIRWLIIHWERVIPRFLEIVQESVKVARMENGGLQNRLPDYYALLDAAQQTALTAFYEMGVLTLPECLEIMNANAQALLGSVNQQAERIAAESPVRKFFEALENLLERQKVYLAPKTNKVVYTPPFNADLVGHFEPGDPTIVYLNDTTCLEHVRVYWSKLGENYDTTQDALRRQFGQVSQLLAKRDGASYTVSEWVASLGKNTRLVAISAKRVFELYGVVIQNPHPEPQNKNRPDDPQDDPQLV